MEEKGIFQGFSAYTSAVFNILNDPLVISVEYLGMLTNFMVHLLNINFLKFLLIVNQDLAVAMRDFKTWLKNRQIITY